MIGDANGDVLYRVTLSGAIKKADGTTTALPLGYDWQFQTGSQEDKTPPYIIDLSPVSGTWDQNIVVQATFSEPVDPSTIAGANPSSGADLKIHAGADIAGQWVTANQYQTIDFIPAFECGVNSCLKPIFCLPGPNTLDGTIFGANATPVTDMSGNKLDGTPNSSTTSGLPTGATPLLTTGWNFTWSFLTSNTMDLTAPKLIKRVPIGGAALVDLYLPAILTFNKPLLYSSLLSSNVGFHEPVPYWNSAQPSGSQTLVNINHSRFNPRQPYTPFVNSNVLDQYQNCYDAHTIYPNNGCEGASQGTDCGPSVAPPLGPTTP